MSRYQKAFTLLELLVVIAIIGMLSSVVMGSVNSAREKSKAIVAVHMVRDLQKAVISFYLDIGSYPPNCNFGFCNSFNDGFSNRVSAGWTGWKGPYYKVWNASHPWGGHFGYIIVFPGETNDIDLDGTNDYAIVLNDDRFGTSEEDNGGRISLEGMTAIDKILDDGNLATGNVRGNGGGWSFGSFYTSAGEIAVKFDAP